MVYGWHPGEEEIHLKLDYTAVNRGRFDAIDDEMPTQHRMFYQNNLPFIPITTLDEAGRPWGSFACSNTGRSGFVRSPTATTLEMDIDVPPGDPLAVSLESCQDSDKKDNSRLIAGIGIDLSNRRRNKFAGVITSVRKKDQSYCLHLKVNQAIGCAGSFLFLLRLAQ